MPKNGIVGEMSVHTRRAADGRHTPFITSAALPQQHAAWPEGTVMVAGSGIGTADAASETDSLNVIGVLDEAVETDEGVGNLIVHGSCPADILKCVDSTGESIIPATAEHINALRGIGIYV